MCGVSRIQLVYKQGDRRTPPETGDKFLKLFNVETNYQTEQVRWCRLPTIDVNVEILPKQGVSTGIKAGQYFRNVAGFFDQTLAGYERAGS